MLLGINRKDGCSFGLLKSFTSFEFDLVLIVLQWNEDRKAEINRQSTSSWKDLLLFVRLKRLVKLIHFVSRRTLNFRNDEFKKILWEKLTWLRRSRARSVVKIGNPWPVRFAYLLVNNVPRAGEERLLPSFFEWNQNRWWKRSFGNNRRCFVRENVLPLVWLYFFVNVRHLISLCAFSCFSFSKFSFLSDSWCRAILHLRDRCLNHSNWKSMLLEEEPFVSSWLSCFEPFRLFRIDCRSVRIQDLQTVADRTDSHGRRCWLVCRTVKFHRKSTPFAFLPGSSRARSVAGIFDRSSWRRIVRVISKNMESNRLCRKRSRKEKSFVNSKSV